MLEAPPLPTWPHGAATMSAQEAFDGTWRRSGALRADRREAIWRQLEAAYSAPSRHYHTLEHVLGCLAFVGVCVASGRQLEDQVAVEWAIWFHDVIYDPKASDNEQRSADLAIAVLADAGLAPATVDRVGSLILATATHLHTPNRDEHVVVDGDLSVLGAPLSRYTEYAVGVRREYGHLSDKEYAAGRAAFLRATLEREQLFATDVGKSLFEQQARANIAHELQLVSVGLLLGGGGPDGTGEPELPSVAEGEEEGA